MPNDPFVILGIRKGASQSEILDAYKQKRSYYASHIFDEGESGAEAARMLELLDGAYQDAMSYSHEQSTVSGESTGFEDVKAAIRSKDMAKAQKLLDDIAYRGGEWHYYQAIIFYEKNWLNESKRQLEIALELDGGNPKYLKALDNLKKKIDGTNAFSQGNPGQGGAGDAYGNQKQYTETGRTYQQRQPDAADGCCAACQALICVDCCCECMGGDCIRCC